MAILSHLRRNEVGLGGCHRTRWPNHVFWGRTTPRQCVRRPPFLSAAYQLLKPGSE